MWNVNRLPTGLAQSLTVLCRLKSLLAMSIRFLGLNEGWWAMQPTVLVKAPWLQSVSRGFPMILTCLRLVRPTLIVVPLARHMLPRNMLMPGVLKARVELWTTGAVMMSLKTGEKPRLAARPVMLLSCRTFPCLTLVEAKVATVRGACRSLLLCPCVAMMIALSVMVRVLSDVVDLVFRLDRVLGLGVGLGRVMVTFALLVSDRVVMTETVRAPGWTGRWPTGLFSGTWACGDVGWMIGDPYPVYPAWITRVDQKFA